MDPTEVSISAAVERLRREIKFGESLDDQQVLKELEGPQSSREAVPFNFLSNATGLFAGDVIPDSLARQIMVVATWRSGSSFLGDLLNHYPGSFYSFEPLKPITEGFCKTRKEPLCLLSNFFKCRLDQNQDESVGSFFLDRNVRLANVCPPVLPEGADCSSLQLKERLCNISPVRLAKVVRLRVAWAEDLLQDEELPNLKVVALFRDPRGLMKSRWSLYFCKVLDECWEIQPVCQRLQEDLQAALMLRNRFPDRVHIVRYEDMLAQPLSVTASIVSFLNLQPFPQLYSFLESHTQPNEEDQANPFGTMRNSSLTASAWRTSMGYKEVEKIQEACGQYMQVLGYNALSSESAMKDAEFSVVSNLGNWNIV